MSQSLQSYSPHSPREPQAPMVNTGAQSVNPAMQYTGNDTNELVRIATPLLTLITQIRHTVEHQNVGVLRSQIIEEIKTLEQRLSEAGYPLRTIIATRYAVCTAIDEAVLSQDWGTNSVWVSGSLLSLFQNETWGGERFYIILDDALRDTRNNIDFIELIYFLMSLGFEGKFFGDEHRSVRDEIRGRIFYHVRHARMKPERNLSPQGKNHSSTEDRAYRKRHLKRMGIITAIAVLALGLFYNLHVYHMAAPTLERLQKLAKVPPQATFAQVIERPLVIRNEGDK